MNSYTAARGSKGGGTVLYISGVNFSPIAGDISIFFGKYPCDIVAEGSNVNMVSCITTPMTGDDEGKQLPITMYTVDLLTVTCKQSSCYFAYSESYTPRITEIYPSIAAGNEEVSFFGTHRISNIGDGRSPDASDLRYLLIGDTTCSNLDIIQEDIPSYYDNSIYCKTFLHQLAG